MKKIILLAVALISACGAEEDIDFKVITAAGQELHAWGVYHWPSNHLSPTVVSKTTSPLYDVPGVSQEWNNLGTPIQLVMSTARKGDVTVSESSSAFWLGLATIYLDSSGHIVKGEVKLNTRLLKKYPPAVAAHVLCQELGHILGLDHNRDELDTCMNDTSAASNAWPYPNAHDAEQLNLAYNHLD
jgi:hypothetical protein